MLERYHRRRKMALDFLGGRCECGSTKNLEFDHKIRSEKLFSIARMWGVAEVVFWKEIKKCQLLCAECHEKKTLRDLGQISAKTSHGTLSSYRYCRCASCREANNQYQREWRLTH
jgi:5-methylcytosine-specific restriction endonuclease McrA